MLSGGHQIIVWRPPGNIYKSPVVPMGFRIGQLDKAYLKIISFAYLINQRWELPKDGSLPGKNLAYREQFLAVKSSSSVWGYSIQF